MLGREGKLTEELYMGATGMNEYSKVAISLPTTLLN
jgi:hypothetical protein